MRNLEQFFLVNNRKIIQDENEPREGLSQSQMI
jgi:hypothetical protein